MRFIVREQEYEKPLAAGLLRHEKSGKATGCVESWRITEVASGYTFLRIDRDERDGPGGQSHLYHLVLSPARMPERLKFRVFGSGEPVQGDVLVEANEIILTVGHGAERFEEVASTSGGVLFCFSSALSLSLAAALAGKDEARNMVMLIENETFGLHKVLADIEQHPEETLAVTGSSVHVRPYSIRFEDKWYKLWIDRFGWPLRMESWDDQIVYETRYIRYRRIRESMS